MNRRTFLGAAGAALASCVTPRPEPSAVDKFVSGLSPEHRAGQTMAIAFHGTQITSAVEEMIRVRGVGGIILRAENAPGRGELQRICADLQRIAAEAKVPQLFLAIDQEGGSVARVALTVFPSQMALAATPDPAAAVRRAAAITADELLEAGVNWNLAPVADVNNEPLNPIIGNRSYGSEPQRVASLVDAAVRAYAAATMLCCAKHFPGHGAATVDSHVGLPLIDVDRARLDRVELVPFRQAIAAGVPAIMLAHLLVPALDPTPALPASLSRRIVTDLLRGELGFNGIILTDDLEMGALATIGEAAAGLRALQAGADFVLFRFDETAQRDGHRLIVDAARNGTLPSLGASVSRLVDAKRRYLILTRGNTFHNPDMTANAAAALDIARQSITVLHNDGKVLPVRGRVVYAIATTTADLTPLPGDSDLATEFERSWPDVLARKFGTRIDESVIASALNEAKNADVVVVGVADIGINDDQLKLVTRLAAAKPTVLVSLRGPYDVRFAPNVAACVCAYDGRLPSLRAVIEVITGQRKPIGALPVTVSDRYPLGAGLRDFA
ncbi:MAG TPA: glycoside hydrolase family 3 N-terminal domain-containing protein [Candidatus Limnocylindria bacterium]|jgi:beta-N-acetylhexosaminidase|nr:glycoside hydrolase family 3 N-terminal domain-containing protein [Candidatus Limnocylindria bacterium]